MAVYLNNDDVDIEVEEAWEQGCASLVPEKSRPRFPKDETRRSKWLDFIDKPNWKPSSRSLLCSKHFDVGSFDRSSCIVRLKSDAVPTLEVQRLKYDKTFNGEIVGVSNTCPSTPLVETSSELTPHESDSIVLSQSDSCKSEISTTSETETSFMLPVHESYAIAHFESEVCLSDTHITSDDTPREAALKKKLKHSYDKLTLKYMKIRNLQRENWRLKQKITALRSIIKELTN